MDGCVRGFHVYQDVWTSIIVEVLACRRETTNIEDRYAIAINKTEEVVSGSRSSAEEQLCRALELKSINQSCLARFRFYICAAFILPTTFIISEKFVRIIRRISILVTEVQEKISGRKYSRLLTDSRNLRKFSSADDSQYTVCTW